MTLLPIRIRMDISGVCAYDDCGKTRVFFESGNSFPWPNEMCASGRVAPSHDVTGESQSLGRLVYVITGTTDPPSMKETRRLSADQEKIVSSFCLGIRTRRDAMEDVDRRFLQPLACGNVNAANLEIMSR
jgi:hypothetical protein